MEPLGEGDQVKQEDKEEKNKRTWTVFDYQNPNIDPLNQVTETGGHSQLLLLLGLHLLLLLQLNHP